VKILYHHRTRAGDAQGIHIAEIQRAFRQRGHEVVEVALVEAGSEARADEQGGSVRGIAGLAARAAGSLPLPAKEALELGYNAVAYRRLVAAIRRHSPDFLYERYAANTFAGLTAARRCRIPFVLEVNSPLAREKAEHDGLFFRRATAGIERRLCAQADVTIAVTGVLAGLLEADGVPGGKVVVMPNGVRRGFGDAATPAAGAAFRRGLGLPPNAVIAGFIGWFRAWHGLERLIEAAASPEWRDAGIHLVLAGDGPAMPALREMRTAHGLEDRVVLCGPVPRGDVEAALAAFDVAVQPAVTSYACPMKILEYMAAGRAIAAPGSANVRELLTDGETALLCPGDANPGMEELHAAVLTLARDPELRRRLGAAARRQVRERGLFWEENARRVEELVKSARGLQGGLHEDGAVLRNREVRSC
jgi:glycosyltransferase involved in cell wall biosynthesis